MDDKILKRMAVRSIALMLAVILISTVTTYHEDGTIYANDTKIVEDVVASSLDESLLDGDLIEEIESENIQFLSDIEGTQYNKTPEEMLSDRYIVINKPIGNKMDISLEDIYMERSIKVKINGITEESLDYNSIVRVKEGHSYMGKPIGIKLEKNPEDKKEIMEGENNDIVTDILITYEHNIETNTYSAIINMVLDSVYVYTIYQNELQYYINLQKPADVYDRLIVVDAGHGGNDVGTFPPGMEYVEKDMNLSIVRYLKKLLDQEKSIKVYYTRLKDEKPYLRPRVRLANDLYADFFISVHCNGSEISQPSGTEVLYNEKSKADGFNSKDLAKICLKELTDTIQLRNRGIVSGSEKYIIRHAKVPMALCEIGYMTNQGDLDFLKESDNRKLAAQGIYNGIIEAFETIESEE